MAFLVVYDANALYGDAQRDLLLRVAVAGLVQARWTNAILDEMQRNLSANRPDIPGARLQALRARMNLARGCELVEGYEPLIEDLKMPDPDDRHVLAAAIKAGAHMIITANLRDFPTEILKPWNVQAWWSRSPLSGPHG